MSPMPPQLLLQKRFGKGRAAIIERFVLGRLRVSPQIEKQRYLGHMNT